MRYLYQNQTLFPTNQDNIESQVKGSLFLKNAKKSIIVNNLNDQISEKNHFEKPTPNALKILNNKGLENLFINDQIKDSEKSNIVYDTIKNKKYF